MTRNKSIVALRPTIRKEATEFSSEELFQNEVLRPILKFQHEIWLLEWQENALFLSVKKGTTAQERRKLIALLFSKNTPLLQRYIGSVLGLFSIEEYLHYLKNKTVLDKRIKELLITRLLSYDVLN